jgi:hypothetical protein
VVTQVPRRAHTSLIRELATNLDRVMAGEKHHVCLHTRQGGAELRLLPDGTSRRAAPVPVRSRVVIARGWSRRDAKILAALLGRIFGGRLELCRLDFRLLGGISDQAYEFG